MQKHIILAAIMLGLLWHPAWLSAQEETIDQTALVLVIDNSGSMDTNDASDLRYAATRLVMTVADDWDEIGVLCFGDSTSTMFALAPMGPTDQRTTITDQVVRRNCTVSGGTNMTDGILEGINVLQQSASKRKYLLLLTDGEPTTPGTLEAVVQAQNAGIVVVPVALGSDVTEFFSAVEQLGLNPRKVGSSAELLREFAEIYSALKPDRYVTVLEHGGTNELRVNAPQQVNRISFVLTPGSSIVENGIPRTCPGDSACRPDAEDKYHLLTIDEEPVEGIWQLGPGGTAIVITRANFRPALAYPPTEDTTQTGYYIPRDMTQTLIGRLQGEMEQQDVPI
ncbi:MAG: VWA domain-containing protein, partial [Chloroflexi bacterium]|nr:VWA domain-containing protein [Chloroflexota bacterium]